MVKLSKKYGVIIQVGHIERFNPAYQAFYKNKEFFNEGTGSADRTITTVRGKPIEVTKKDFVTEVAGHDTTRMTAAKKVGNWGGTGNGPNGTDQRTGHGRGGAIVWELFGNPNASSTPVGGEKTY